MHTHNQYCMNEILMSSCLNKAREVMGNPNHEPAKLELPPSQTTDEFTGCPAFLRACVRLSVLSYPVLSCQSPPCDGLSLEGCDGAECSNSCCPTGAQLSHLLTPSEPSSSRNCWHILATWFHSPKRWMWSQYRFGFYTIELWTH